jgi:hypothetical protein
VIFVTRPPDPKAKNAYIEEAAVRRALDNVAIATNNFTDPYLFASYGLAEIAAGQPQRAEGILAKLRAAAETERGGSFWELQANTPFYGWGHAGRVETTALAVQFLDRAGHSEDKLQGINLLSGDKGPGVLRHCGKPVRFPVRSKGEWTEILWLKVVCTMPLKAAKLVRT